MYVSDSIRDVCGRVAQPRCLCLGHLGRTPGSSMHGQYGRRPSQCISQYTLQSLYRPEHNRLAWCFLSLAHWLVQQSSLWSHPPHRQHNASPYRSSAAEIKAETPSAALKWTKQSVKKETRWIKDGKSWFIWYLIKPWSKLLLTLWPFILPMYLPYASKPLLHALGFDNEHKIDIIMKSYGWRVSKELLIYTLNRRAATLAFIWESRFWPLVTFESNILSLLAQVWSPPTVWLFSC